MRKSPSFVLLLFAALGMSMSFCGQSPDTKAHPAAGQHPPDLSAIAGEWVELTATDSGWIIYQPCDVGTMQMRIGKENNTWTLFFYGQQEAWTYWVDQQLGEAGKPDWRLRIHTDWDTIPLPLLFKPVVDDPDLLDMQYTSSQGDLYHHRLVKSAARHKFRSIEQDCYECWSDECDEFEH